MQEDVRGKPTSTLIYGHEHERMILTASRGNIELGGVHSFEDIVRHTFCFDIKQFLAAAGAGGLPVQQQAAE